jgi:hypothetical protein
LASAAAETRGTRAQHQREMERPVLDLDEQAEAAV